MTKTKSEKAALISQIQTIDLEEVRKYFLIRKQWTIEKVDRAIDDYRKYLFLTQVVGNVIPTEDIDEIWHRHILHLRQYIMDCQRVFGYILYHKPSPILETANSVCVDGDTGEILDPPEYKSQAICTNESGDLIEPPPGSKTKNAICQDEGGTPICHPVYDTLIAKNAVTFEEIVSTHF